MSVGMSSNGFTVWFTGMAGAGKSTLSQALSQRLKRLGMSPEILDAADVAQMLNIGSAATKDERNAEVKRLTWVCRLITRGGGVVFQSAVQSPNREVRDEARRQISRFVEVFVDCPIDQLISRDKTGQYKRALAGELKNLPGITEPYEPPTHPEVLVDTSKMTVDDAVEHLVGQLVALRYVDPGQAGLKSRPKLTAVSKVPLRPPPLEPAPKPVLYKAPPKSAAPAKEEKPAKASAKPAAAAKPALKAVPNKPAAKATPVKKAAAAKPAAPAKPAAKDAAKLKSAKLVVAKAPTSSAAKTGKASKPAAKPVGKSKPALKAVARPEAKRAAGGRKR
jgi:adenylyl-sulfate kinase